MPMSDTHMSQCQTLRLMITYNHLILYYYQCLYVCVGIVSDICVNLYLQKQIIQKIHQTSFVQGLIYIKQLQI